MVVYGLNQIHVPTPGTPVKLSSPITDKVCGMYFSMAPGGTGNIFLKDKNGTTFMVLNAAADRPEDVGFVYGGDTLKLSEYSVDCDVANGGPIVGIAVL